MPPPTLQSPKCPRVKTPHRDSDFSEPSPQRRLEHPVDLSPLVDVLLAHDVGVDEEVSVAHAEVFLTGGTLEALQVVHFVLHPHRHLVGTDPLVTGGAETILAKEPGGEKRKKS